MTNTEIAKMTEDQFLASCEEARAEKEGKKAINTSPLSIREQLDRFGKSSFTKEEEAAHHADALSV
jgi:hypothetical protein